jgi:D-proline reductase (dithiol) PrdB
MKVDSFKYLPRVLRALYETEEIELRLPLPWEPLPRPLPGCTFGLVTSAGLYHLPTEPPFDLEREKVNPTWGDPSYRTIPIDVDSDQIGVSHLHLNPRDIERDFNILLPIHRFIELVTEGKINALAEVAVSFMGYQGHPPDTGGWERVYAPEVIQRFRTAGVDCIFITTA